VSAADAALPGLAPFRPRAPWWGGDLQTVRNFLVGRTPDLLPWPGRRLELPLNDGTGDRLVAHLHGEGRGRRPLAVLIHGITGCAESHYVRATARHLLGLGYPVLRLNLRGAGASRPLCREQYHAGRSADLTAALSALPPEVVARGIVPVGYSLGGNMLLKLLAEGSWSGDVRAAATVSAPIDLKATQLRFMAPRNRLYHAIMLRWMKAEILAGPGPMPEAERRAVRAARTVFAFDDTVVAPRNGFAGADDYYARCSALRFLSDLAVPTLLIHALDDPWIPAQPYLAFDWTSNPCLTPLLPAGGGHVGFHGSGNAVAWHDVAIARFLDLQSRTGSPMAGCCASAWARRSRWPGATRRGRPGTRR
jgi:predicted alpha/beta-fold hydrolase